MKTSPRSQKLSGVIMEKIGPVIRKFFSPEDVGVLTVTAVEVSGDLEWADVFVVSIGGKKRWLGKLNQLERKISHELLRDIPKRRILKIRFKIDKSVERMRNSEIKSPVGE